MSSWTRIESIRPRMPDMVSGSTSPAHPGSMPVPWKDDDPAAQAASRRSTTASPALRG